jgi:hypothetical protein
MVRRLQVSACVTVPGDKPNDKQTNLSGAPSAVATRTDQAHASTNVIHQLHHRFMIFKLISSTVRIMPVGINPVVFTVMASLAPLESEQSACRSNRDGSPRLEGPVANYKPCVYPGLFVA